MICPECGANLHGVVRLEPVPTTVSPGLKLGQLVSVVSTTIPDVAFKPEMVEEER